MTVEVTRVTKRYRSGAVERTVLDGVSLVVDDGRFTAVMGPSGSGKSTLLHIMGGIDRRHEGTVCVDGVVLGDCDDDQLARLRRRSVGFVFQAFNLVPVLTAIENVALPGVIDGQSPAAMEKRARALLDLLGLADRAEQRPAELSGGEQQRVAIARALFLEPAVLLADEPTGNLDSGSGAEVMDVLRRANREMGQSIVLVTHDPAVAAAADEIVALRDARLRVPLRFDEQQGAQHRERRVVRWLADADADADADAGRARLRPLVAR